MTPKDTDFYGKEVADAIKKACDKLQVPQEQLEIEVVATGSTGIFGLIRKKAHIKAYIRAEAPEQGEPQQDVPQQDEPKQEQAEVQSHQAEPLEKAQEKAFVQAAEPQEEAASQQQALEQVEQAEEHVGKVIDDDDEDDLDEDSEGDSEDDGSGEELSPETLTTIEQELSKILELMGYSAPVEIHSKGISVVCHVGGEHHEDVLTGQDGKTLDSIQYLLRKIVARKVPNRLRLTVDVGNYREERLVYLKERAAELAEQVKEDGKTQVIPALSPSERRVVHVSLQEDKEIRSRSVGDGLFKKILIYKPGKGSKSGGRKRGSSRGRRSNNGRKKNE
ncbi:MAG: protein jag [Desulfopila sp.]